ncbi:hypothetical protein [Archangium sp.]|uniref:hypothetical protein n=1 Tax=Archangium sp. TaxID=1872627 RepID=UPI00286B2D38|nr:hypothetical protein [Archangium sp.]
METALGSVIAVLVAMSVVGAVVWRYRRVGRDEADEALVVEEKGGLASKVVVERRGRQGLSCRDGIRVDVRATFLLKEEREVGSGRASREAEVQGLFEERFAGVLESAASTFTFEELAADRGLFIEHVMMEVGNELSGFKLERVSLGKLEQTPLDQLDATNEQDARGILTRTERSTGLAVEKTEQERYRLWMEEREREEARGAVEDPRRGESELEWEVDRALAERSRR